MEKKFCLVVVEMNEYKLLLIVRILFYNQKLGQKERRVLNEIYEANRSRFLDHVENSLLFIRHSSNLATCAFSRKFQIADLGVCEPLKVRVCRSGWLSTTVSKHVNAQDEPQTHSSAKRKLKSAIVNAP